MIEKKKDRHAIKIYGFIAVILVIIIIFVVMIGNARQPGTNDVTAETNNLAETTEVAIEAENADSTYDAEAIANGELLYITCSACHGPDGTGIDGMGKDLVNGEFTLTSTDDELATLIINGRPIWDEVNTTMLDMPPRGGNPTLTDEDIYDIVAYIRSLQSEHLEE